MNKVRIFLIVLFLSGAAASLLLYLKSEPPAPKPPKTAWEFKLKHSRPMPDFTCRAGKIYSFAAAGDIVSITIDNTTYKSHSFLLWGHSGWDGVKKAFTVRFSKDTTVSLDCKSSGLFSGSAYVRIKEIEFEHTLPKLMILYPRSFNDYSIPVSRGQRINLLKYNEHLYLGLFRNGREIKKYLIKSGELHYYRFWEDCELRFKAAEVPFLMVVPRSMWPFYEKLNVKSIIGALGERYSHESSFARVWYLNPGAVRKTKIWLDKGDWAVIYGHDSDYKHFGDNCSRYKKPHAIAAYVNEKKLPYKKRKWSCFAYYAREEGYLSVKVLNKCVITYIHIYRGQSWKLDLKPGQVKKINVGHGDKLLISSNSRYYIDDRLMDPGDIYYDITHDGSISFKPSIDPRPIKVRVQARRGH